MMEQHGVVELSVPEVTNLLNALPPGPLRNHLGTRLDCALRWELFNKDGSVQGQFTYFPSREAEHNAGSWENVLTIRDRHTGKIHRRILTRWTTRTLADLGGTEPQLEDIPRRRSEKGGGDAESSGH